MSNTISQVEFDASAPAVQTLLLAQGIVVVPTETPVVLDVPVVETVVLNPLNQAIAEAKAEDAINAEDNFEPSPLEMSIDQEPMVSTIDSNTPAQSDLFKEEADKTEKETPVRTPTTDGVYMNVTINVNGHPIRVGLNLNTAFYTKVYEANVDEEDRQDNVDVLNLIDAIRKYGTDVIQEAMVADVTFALQGVASNKQRVDIMDGFKPVTAE